MTGKGDGASERELFLCGSDDALDSPDAGALLEFLSGGQEAGDVRGVVFGADGSVEWVRLRPGDRFYIRNVASDDASFVASGDQDDGPPF